MFQRYVRLRRICVFRYLDFQYSSVERCNFIVRSLQVLFGKGPLIEGRSWREYCLEGFIFVCLWVYPDIIITFCDQVFYGPPEPTYFVNTDPYRHQRRPVMMPAPVYRPRELSPTRYRTRALVAPSSTESHIVPAVAFERNVKTHPQVCMH